MTLERLELVKNIFIFSCFTGLAYIDVYNLTYDKIVTVEDRQWLITKRYKTSVDENVMLLDIPLAIIRKYYDINRKGGESLSYDEQPAYQLIFERNCRPLWHKKESDLPHGKAYFRHYVYIQRGTNGVCNIKSLDNTNIRITQIYARITNKKVERDMEELAGKLSKFNTAMGI